MSLEDVRSFGEGRAAFWADPPRGTCTGCGDEDVILHQGDVCANCYRQASNRDQPYPCDRCGQGKAFRDPVHRRDEYLCQTCHLEDGYVPGERAMITRVQARVGATHSQGRREPCIAAGHGTACKGQIKPRGKLGVLCDFHSDPRKYLNNKGV